MVKQISKRSVLAKYNLKLMSVNNDGSINVRGHIYINANTKPRLGIPSDLKSLNIHTLEGNFFCSGNKLTNFVGCPIEILGNFICLNTKLTNENIKGFPVQVSHLYVDRTISNSKTLISHKTAVERINTINDIINS
ncbi:hypothetical protein GKZ90_0012610 [Flavobacterium sp. MC2016-06]|jgi:uncharacterized protein (DUF39 family)|uniref:hypothetical protein n=1 Tax=Flavobacterium sp. MC2016-06 TaxID=2676308 RepID=UPI0012BA9AA5|nr:hypothetical protein [Flavobacterium sp. MC2016-06]MBU3860152.1 hypothetical protein [Flavobacterium sp. MC2016-06]